MPRHPVTTARTLALALALTAATTACTGDDDSPASGDRPSDTSAPDDPFAPRAAPAAVAGPWRDGNDAPLPDGLNPDDDFALGAHAYRGADHCGWENVTFLDVAWPPGSVTTSFAEARQFVWDPEGALATNQSLLGTLQEDVDPPADAAATGLHTDDVELWIAPSDEDAAYLRHADGTFDRWPRAEPTIQCE